MSQIHCMILGIDWLRWNNENHINRCIGILLEFLYNIPHTINEIFTIRYDLLIVDINAIDYVKVPRIRDFVVLLDIYRHDHQWLLPPSHCLNFAWVPSLFLTWRNDCFNSGWKLLCLFHYHHKSKRQTLKWSRIVRSWSWWY